MTIEQRLIVENVAIEQRLIVENVAIEQRLIAVLGENFTLSSASTEGNFCPDLNANGSFKVKQPFDEQKSKKYACRVN